jgi:hypothetical protein
MAASFEFDVGGFRLAFPLFTDPPYTDDTLQGYWDVAVLYISDVDYGYLNGAARYRALNLMTAHLAALSDIINGGQTPGQVQSSTIDKISVTLTPPPNKTQFNWWLNLTGYGQQLAALLATRAVGGLFIPSWRGPRGLN